MLSFDPTQRERRYIIQKAKAVEALAQEKKTNRKLVLQQQKKITDLSRKLKISKQRNKKINNRNKSLIYMLRRERLYRQKAPKLVKRNYVKVLNNLMSMNLSMAYMICHQSFSRVKISPKEAMVLLMCYRFEYLKVDTMKKTYPSLITHVNNTRYALASLRKKGMIEMDGKDIYFITQRGVMFIEKLSGMIMHYTRKYGIGFRQKKI